MFSTWRRKHHLPLRLESEFQEVLQEQWAKHIACMHADPRLTWKDVSVARALLHKDFVVHCEDHEPNHLMIFCPRFYFQSALRTWQDPEVFESLSGSRDQWNQWVLDRLLAFGHELGCLHLCRGLRFPRWCSFGFVRSRGTRRPCRCPLSLSRKLCCCANGLGLGGGCGLSGCRGGGPRGWGHGVGLGGKTAANMPGTQQELAAVVFVSALAIALEACPEETLLACLAPAWCSASWSAMVTACRLSQSCRSCRS